MHGDIVGSDTWPAGAPFPARHQAGPPPGEAGVNQGSYEAHQWELADLRREMVGLRRTPETALAFLLRPLLTTRTEAAPSTPTLTPR